MADLATNTALSPANALTQGGNALDLYGGLARGGALGDIQAGAAGARLATGGGLVTGTGAQELGGAAGALGGAAGIYTGLKQGGISGYGSAAVGALRGAQGVATAVSGFEGGAAAGGADAANLAGSLGSVAGYVAAPLALYNFAKNWQSGSTGSDTLGGAEAGAAIGSIIPGVGTVIGGIVGAAVGALSSDFGGGKKDPETVALSSYVPQFNANPSIASQLSPSQNFQLLAGVFDAKNNSPGHATPLEQIFGRQGEGNFVNQMMTQVNAAIASGKVPKNATPQQLYQSVVNPWLTSMKGNYGGGNTSAAIQSNWTDSSGQQFGNALQASVTNLLGQWQAGAITPQTPLGIAGQADTTVPAYGTGSSPTVHQGPHANVQVRGGTPTGQNTGAVPPVAVAGNSMAVNPVNTQVAPGTNALTTGGNPYLTGGGPGTTNFAPVAGGAPAIPSGSGSNPLLPAAGAAAVAGAPAISSALGGAGLPPGVTNALPYLAAGGLGLYQAGQTATQNQGYVNSLAGLGQPLTATGSQLINAGLQGQITPTQQTVVSTLQSQGQQLIDSAAPLASIANTAFANYQAGQLQPGQQAQIDAWTASAKQSLAQSLATSGISDSSILASQDAAIDSQATQLKANLMAQNLGIADQQFTQWLTATQAGQQLQASGAQYAATSVNNMLTTGLQFEQAGIAPQTNAVQTAINQNAALSTNVSNLMKSLAGAYTLANGPAAQAQDPTGGVSAGTLRDIGGGQGNVSGIPSSIGTPATAESPSSLTNVMLPDVQNMQMPNFDVSVPTTAAGGVPTQTFNNSFFDPGSDAPNIDFGSGDDSGGG